MSAVKPPSLPPEGRAEVAQGSNLISVGKWSSTVFRDSPDRIKNAPARAGQQPENAAKRADTGRVAVDTADKPNGMPAKNSPLSAKGGLSPHTSFPVGMVRKKTCGAVSLNGNPQRKEAGSKAAGSVKINH